MPQKSQLVQAKPTAAEQAQFQSNLQRRIEQQQQIKYLTEQRWLQAAITQAVGMSEKIVQRYVMFPALPLLSLKRQWVRISQ